MKKFSFMHAAGALMMVAGIAFLTSCEGPAGPAGKDGLNGADGKDGVDANATCTQCHNSSSIIVAKQAQYMHSGHATGSTTFENATGCAICHTSEGYQERISNGVSTKLSTTAAIADPSPIGCRTCHTIHTNYDATDWALRATAAVVMIADSTNSVDYGKGNACINCHQSRPISPNFVTGVVNDSMSIASSRWGTHHGPQAEVEYGVLGYNFGQTPQVTGAHKTLTDGCVTCHMADAVGVVSGGHTFTTYSEEEGFNTNACKNASCHGSSVPDIAGFQAGVQAKLTALETKFKALGYMYDVPETDPNYLLWKASSSKKLKVSKDMAGAMFNYKMAWEDKSLGVHNPKYVNFLLDQAMNYLGVTVK